MREVDGNANKSGLERESVTALPVNPASALR
jgi:hypothetical protein